MAYQLAYAELAGLWIEAGGSGQAAAVAAAIAMAESGGCQYALAGPVDIRPVKACHWTVTNGENSCGFWQINLYAHPQYSAPSIFDQLANARAAIAISRNGANFDPWTTYTDGAYRQYLQANFVPTLPGPGGGTTTGTLSGGTPEKIGVSGHKGYADLRWSVASHLHTQLVKSRRTDAATLRLLGRASRVKRGKP